MKFIKDLNEINKAEIYSAGGKGANLGELMKIGIIVPPGFVISAEAFSKFLGETDIKVEIDSRWRRINVNDIESVEKNSEIIKDLILKAQVPKEIEKEIFQAFKKLRAKYVAVRSSATAEDSKIDSWAGELETYLNTTKENLIENVKKCWASLFSPRALFYRAKRNLWDSKVLIGVIVQKMVQSDVSGICFTVHPVTKDKDQMVIEACWGLGEMLVQGKVTPDTYVIGKSDFKILDVNVSNQEKMIVKNKIGNKIISVSKSKKSKQKLSQTQIKELAKICLKIENHYKVSQDIEWALAGNKFYILQSRPITIL